MKKTARDPICRSLLAEGWIEHVEWHETIDSTNSAARRWLNSGQYIVPGLFVADHQTAGRGRLARVWWSPSGCLMFTLVIHSSELPADRHSWSQLSLVTGVAVADAVDKLLASDNPAAYSHVQLKWPNDLYLSHRKLAGILIETVKLPGFEDEAATDANQLSVHRCDSVAFMIGVGLNVALDWNTAPPEVAARATCLKRESHVDFGTDVVLSEVIDSLHTWLDGWRCGNRYWLDGWQKRCLLGGKFVELRSLASPEAGTIVGRCESVSSNGELLIRTETELLTVSTGEIIRWW